MHPVAQVLVVVLLLGSCWVWWRIAADWRHGRSPLPWREHPLVWMPPWVAVAVLFVWIAIPVAASLFLGVRAANSLQQVQATCLANAVLLPVIFGILSLAENARLADFGLGIRRWKADLRDGAAGFLASLVPVYLVLLASSPLRSPETQHPFLQMLVVEAGWETLAWVMLAGVILAPLAEELVFRVILQGALEPHMPASWAILLVAILFSVVHPWPDLLPLFPLAIILGYVYYRRHSYLAVVTLHVLFNGANMLLALLTTAEDNEEVLSSVSHVIALVVPLAKG